MIRHFGVGDHVRIDILNETDPIHERLYGRRGEVVAVLEDDTGDVTEDVRGAVQYRVQLEDDS